MRAIDALPVETSAGHRAGRDCPCGPVAMRDLATGAVSVWVHHRFLPDKRELAPIYEPRAPRDEMPSGSGSRLSGAGHSSETTA